MLLRAEPGRAKPRPPACHGLGDVARLSPLKPANLNCLGRRTFCAAAPVGGGLRPLRDPATAGLEEDDEEEPKA
ncbi:hypothetical protein ACFVT2_06820 [Streptomyces sp. NPDC058000]|uniref:hypothetical protein n=1 Tax=Streptomyces sp. NPDC058000 TaxID=3346299 RepID=UPI0036E243A3